MGKNVSRGNTQACGILGMVILFPRSKRKVVSLLLTVCLLMVVFVPAASGAAPAASGGGYHTMVVKGDGTVWGWGRGGALGEGTDRFANSTVPVQAKDINGVVAVEAGARISVALKADGTVWTWGDDSWGLGHGEFVTSKYPRRVEGISGVTDIAVGCMFFTLALKADGTVWAWGYNGAGMLGDGSTECRYTPVQVRGLTDIKAIDAGTYHSVALKKDGTVWAWGDNIFGTLGTGFNGMNVLTPEQVRGLTGVVAVAAGGRYTLVLKGDGTVWAWGHGVSDMLPGSVLTTRTTPTQIPGLSNVTAVAAGDSHSLFLKKDGTVWAWGSNRDGQLGTGSKAVEAPWQEKSPQQVLGLSNVSAVSTGGFAGRVFSMAMVPDRSGKIVLRIGQPTARIGGVDLYAWGENDNGQLGDGSTALRTTPVKVPVDLTPVIPVDVPPFIEGGRTLVPLRFIGEQLGATIGWDGATQKITYTKGDTTVILWIGKNTAEVNGQSMTLEAPPRIIDGRTVVPLRFVGEAFGAGLEWEGSTQSITLTP